LGSNAMIGKCAYETNRSGLSARRDFCEVGVLGFLGIGKTVETATDFDNLTSLSQRVQCVGVYALFNQIASSKRDSFFAKDLQCAI
jgi:hypothetical protein